MIKVSDVYNFIDSFAPFGSQFDWDNAGLLLGSKEQQVTRIAFALDATVQVIEDAVAAGCDLLVTHHPVIFKPLKEIDFSSPVGVAVRYSLPVICAHTNLDISSRGVNTALAEKIGLKNISTTPVNGELLWSGEISETDAASFAKTLSNSLNTAVTYSDSGKNIRKVAVCGGAAGEYLYAAADAGMDAYVTGEVHHHEYLDSARIGISVFCAGHFETENPVIPALEKMVREHFNIDTIIITQQRPAEYCGE